MLLEPTGIGLSLALVSIILLILSWIVVFTRCLIRLKIHAFGIDDWLMCAGLILYTLACQATITGAYHGIGAHADRLTIYFAVEGRKWFMFFQLFYVASTAPIKSSICVTLLRITNRPILRYILFVVIFISLVAAVITDITVLTWCKPVKATWDRFSGTCGNADIITNVSYFISTTSIVTDWLCAILPGVILWDVKLRFRIKASVATVLALGIIASTATIFRLKYLLNYLNPDPDEFLYGIAYIAVWSMIESGIGLIAGSLSVLRPLLRYSPFFEETERGSGNTGIGGSSARKSHRLETFRVDQSLRTQCEAGKKNWEELSDAESQKYILKESQVTVSHEAGPASSYNIDISQERSDIS